jgi:hypothetical protein
MQIRLYLDEDAMDSDLVRALRLRGVDVTTALDAGLTSSADEAHLKHAIASERTLYSFNVSDFMALHTSYFGREETACRNHPRSATTLQRWRADAPIGPANPNAIHREYSQ